MDRSPFLRATEGSNNKTEVTMINTVTNTEALNVLKTRTPRKGASVSARIGSDRLVADLARKTSWAWRLNASYMN